MAHDNRIEGQISDALISLLNKSGGREIPSVADIAELTGLHRNTVAKHLKTIRFAPMDCVHRALTPLVLNRLFAQTRENVQAVKLWLQVVEGWNESSKVELSGDVAIKAEIDINDIANNPDAIKALQDFAYATSGNRLAENNRDLQK